VPLDDDLVAYYEAEARGRHRVDGGELRQRLRHRFAGMLRRAGWERLVDVGCGPGLDTEAWQRDGFGVIGVDLARGNVALVHERGLVGVAASLYSLPLRTAAFDALWTMSTFVHVPDERFDEAMTEMLRVVPPGGLLAIGTWGGLNFEGVREFGELRPYRFFSLRPHDRWARQLAEHGELVAFDTFESTGSHGWEYQFAVIRAPG
jgi:SAM-dependent methyltransferase